MKKRSEEWKQYMKEAKIRISQSKFQPIDDENFYINCRKLNRQDLSRINSQISEILASEEFVSDPLGKLIENETFTVLSEEEKNRYILNLSSVYLSLRSKFKK